jgi:large subunit ribosomal protein L4
MSIAIVLDDSMNKTEELNLPKSFDGINSHNLYLYVKAYLSNIRANSANTKSRSAVKGGGKKPWSQKGGGRARAGSITSPVFVGGGVAHGPTNKRNYYQKVNKKQQKLALKYAINEKAKNSKLYITQSIEIESGKTKDACALIDKLNSKSTLVVTDRFNFSDEKQIKTLLAFRNLKNVDFIETDEIDAYIVSVYDSVLIVKNAYDELVKEG